MKTTFTACASWSLCLLLATGCMTTTSTRVKRGKSGRPGVEVLVREDGTLRLYGNPIDKKTLVRRLIKEESAHKGRAIILEANGQVRRDTLVDLREYLVANHIPNVVIVTPVNACSFEETNPYWQDAD